MLIQLGAVRRGADVWVKAFGRIAGAGAAHGTPDKVSPFDGGSVVELQLCRLSMDFYLF